MWLLNLVLLLHELSTVPCRSSISIIFMWSPSLATVLWDTDQYDILSQFIYNTVVSLIILHDCWPELMIGNQLVYHEFQLSTLVHIY